MDEYYKIMSDVLDIEYQIKAAIYVLGELEDSYTEETDSRTKYLSTVMKGFLTNLRSDTGEIITLIDRLTATGKGREYES